MKVISIKELHAETGRWVRAAREQTIVVTDRGKKVAALKPHEETVDSQVVLDPLERLKWMPVTSVDSTSFISDDRGDR